MELSDLNITIIGAGKIAYSLTGALIDRGLVISSVISRKILSAKKLAGEYKIDSYSDKIESISPDSNLIILSVQDDQIKNIADNIARLKLDFRKKIFMHLSGSLNSEVLSGIKKKGGVIASFHILQTFPSQNRVPLNNCYAAVETDSASTKKTLCALAEALQLIPFPIQAERKTDYHIACVTASNFLAGNMFFAQQNIQRSDIKYNAMELTASLINATLKNVKEKGAVNALSGPVERNDIETVMKHIKTLKKNITRSKKLNPDKLMLLSYLSQSLLLIEVAAIKNGFEDEARKELKDKLVLELKKFATGI